MRSITEHDLRKVLRTMVNRGVKRMSVRVHQDLVQLFAWAEKRQPWRGLLIEGNPADLIEIRKIVSKDFDTVNEREHERLGTVTLPLGAKSIGRPLGYLALHATGVRVVSLRRASGTLAPLEDDPVLEEGDALVLSGKPEVLAVAEQKLLRG